MTTLNETSLRAGDLRMMVSHVIEIDRYKSKMGDDKDVTVISFTVENRDVAKDLMGFIEKGYKFVLDADTSPGELNNGKYKVFVELERTRRVIDQIIDILYGVGKLSDISEFKFRYYTHFNSIPATKEELSKHVPTTGSEYALRKSQKMLESYDTFFDQDTVDRIVMEGDVIQFTKPYAAPLNFKFVGFDKSPVLLESITDKISFGHTDMAEIMFLTRYIGDYNITKLGNQFVFENKGYAVSLERII